MLSPSVIRALSYQTSNSSFRGLIQGLNERFFVFPSVAQEKCDFSVGHRHKIMPQFREISSEKTGQSWIIRDVIRQSPRFSIAVTFARIGVMIGKMRTSGRLSFAVNSFSNAIEAGFCI